jgi:hypothetical protein
MMMKGVIPLLILSSAAVADDNPDNWYKRYAQYPEYCSTPAEMHARRIPPLRDDNPHLGETRLVHVTTVIRHGARTPWSSNQECWKGYWDSDETGIWNCDLTTILAPPTPTEVKEEEGDHQMKADNAMFLFEKKYDALADPKDGLTNELKGTCQLGQLLLQGYEQEIQNGQFLREAYLYDGQKYDHDERMQLLDISFEEYSPWDSTNLHYRADDDQRTLMSGQVLLRGLFGPEVTKEFEKTKVYPTIPVHTADRKRDILDANEKVCPKLVNLRQEAEQSKEYQQFNNSLKAVGIRNFKATKLGKTATNDQLLDCLMTTMCTDRPLPEIINDYGNTTSWFRALSEFVSVWKKRRQVLDVWRDSLDEESSQCYLFSLSCRIFDSILCSSNTIMLVSRNGVDGSVFIAFRKSCSSLFLLITQPTQNMPWRHFGRKL